MTNEVTKVADDVVVSIDYTLTVDGEVVDSTKDSYPLEYIQGHSNIIPGLEKALTGLGVGETKEVLVPRLKPTARSTRKPIPMLNVYSSPKA